MTISLAGVSYVVGSKHIVNEVDLEVGCGEVVVLLGPNGAGKSTLLKLISGILVPESGTVKVLGKKVHELGLAERARSIGVLTQRVALDFPFTAREVIAMGRSPYGAGVSGAAILDELVDELAIDADQDYLTMSGGERQLVQIARVFAQVWERGEKAVLLMDEPMTALDMKHQVQVISILRRLAKSGLSQIVVMHDINMAATIADKVVLMSSGGIVAFGSVSDVLTETLLEETFSTPVEVSKQPYFRAKSRP
ncbi:MAG: ATP-binding cassette domain-containing protein [Pseudomonadales bacterium]|jgi:iron complex transport system ATP-binding protein|nr:ATP-binding cassette domain-containing protein [Pseudomonadales bacterium]